MKKILQFTAWALAFGAGYFFMQLYVRGEEAAISGDVRKAFVENAIRACQQRQFGHPDNAGIPIEVLARYCDCYANGLANSLTNSDLRDNRLRAGGAITPFMQSKIDAVVPGCAQDMKSQLGR